MYLVMQCLLKYATDAACIHGCNDFIKKLRKKLPQKYLLMNKDLFSQKVSPGSGNRSVTRVPSVKKERGAYLGGGHLFGRGAYSEEYGIQLWRAEGREGGEGDKGEDTSDVWRDQTCYLDPWKSTSLS